MAHSNSQTAARHSHFGSKAVFAPTLRFKALTLALLTGACFWAAVISVFLR